MYIDIVIFILLKKNYNHKKMRWFKVATMKKLDTKNLVFTTT
jgi:hypothetical protein